MVALVRWRIRLGSLRELMMMTMDLVVAFKIDEWVEG